MVSDLRNADLGFGNLFNNLFRKIIYPYYWSNCFITFNHHAGNSNRLEKDMNIIIGDVLPHGVLQIIFSALLILNPASAGIPINFITALYFISIGIAAILLSTEYKR